MPAIMEAIRTLSAEDKFSVIDMLWRDIAAEDPETPEWHYGVLREREESLADGSARLLDWEDVKAELRERRAAAV